MSDVEILAGMTLLMVTMNGLGELFKRIAVEKERDRLVSDNCELSKEIEVLRNEKKYLELEKKHMERERARDLRRW